MINEDYSKFTSSISPDSYLFSAHPSVSEKILRKLKRGDFPIEASIDLHGYTLAQAEDALEAFMQDSLADHLRTLLIIHGKGAKAILKNHVNSWLGDQHQVLAFCSAKQKDGGLGAVYVRLKKQLSSGDNCEEE